MGQAVPLKGVYFRSVEYRYMDPADVLSGAGTRAHGGRFAAVGIRAVYLSATDSGASKEITARKARLGGAVRLACLNKADLTASMELSRELEAEGIQGLLFPSVVGGDDNLVVYRANCGRRTLTLQNEQQVIDQAKRIAAKHK